MSFKFSKSSLSRLNTVNPLLKQIFLKALPTSPYDFGIPKDGGKRTAKRQNELYQQGRSIPGKIITNADGYNKPSYHQSGNAVDIYAYVNGKPSWNVMYFAPIARHLQKVAKEHFNVNLEWGGDWTWKDYGHFQISNYPSTWNETEDIILEDSANPITKKKKLNKTLLLVLIFVFLITTILIFKKK